LYDERSERRRKENCGVVVGAYKRQLLPAPDQL